MKHIPFQKLQLLPVRQVTGKSAVLFHTVAHALGRFPRFHCLQNRFIPQKQALSFPQAPAFLFRFFPLQLAVGGQIRRPGGKILDPRRNGTVPQQLAPVLPQGEQVQQHLQPHAVEYVAVVKIFFPGFVIHHPVVVGFSIGPGVHPVHKTPQNGVHPLVGNGDGRQSIIAAEIYLKIHRLEQRFLQFQPQLPDHHIQFPDIPVEQVA